MFTITRRCLLALAAGLLLAGCANLLGPRDVEVPVARLQASLDKRFPLKNRALELFDIQLSHPQISMKPDTGRVGLTLEAEVAPPFSGKTWYGRLELSGVVGLEPARNQVLLRDLHVDRFVTDGEDDTRRRQLVKISNVLVERLLPDVVLHTWKPEDLRGYVPVRVTPTANALVISLEPAR